MSNKVCSHTVTTKVKGKLHYYAVFLNYLSLSRSAGKGDLEINFTVEQTCSHATSHTFSIVASSNMTHAV